jgi:hypothetical protein
MVNKQTAIVDLRWKCEDDASEILLLDDAKCAKESLYILKLSYRKETGCFSAVPV